MQALWDIAEDRAALQLTAPMELDIKEKTKMAHKAE